MTAISQILRNVGKDKTTVVMTGPLSEVFAKTLNQMYAKRDYITDEKNPVRKDDTYHQPAEGNWIELAKGKFAIESQQLDEEAHYQQLAAGAMMQGNDSSNKLIVYAADGANTDEQDLRKIATIFSSVNTSLEAALILTNIKTGTEDEPDNALVAKVFEPKAIEDQVVAYNQAVTMLAKAFHVPVYNSLDEFKQEVLS